MTNPNFEKLAEESAAGLRADRELFLDVKQELRAHLDDTAAQFQSEGKTPEESAALTTRAFGSPLDIAAELLDANRRRMRFRAIARMMLTAVLLPVAIVLALYLGYGRFARLASMYALPTTMYDSESGSSIHRLPTLPGFGALMDNWHSSMNINDAENMRQHWEKHKNEPVGREYYATYALLLQLDSPSYVAAMQQGEKIEPENALYPFMLASYYFSKGLETKKNKKGSAFEMSYKVRDRHALDQGIEALLATTKKPYLHMYERERLHKMRDSLPNATFTEDYIEYLASYAATQFPHLSHFRDLGRDISCASRQLLLEGKKKDAEEVMDAWKPIVNHLANDTDDSLIYSLVTLAFGRITAGDASHLYPKLGALGKAKEAAETYQRLDGLRKKKVDHTSSNHQQFTDILRNHASILAYQTFPISDSLGVTNFPTLDDLTPARMHEHIMVEQIAVMALLSILLILTIAAAFQGFFWHLRLRRAASAPILLLPPPREIARILLFGVVLPVAVYAIYTRLPIVGGREYGWGSSMRWRFTLEILLTFATILFLTARMARNFVRRRYLALGLEMPDLREEKRKTRLMRWLTVAAVAMLALAFFTSPDGDYPFFLTMTIVGVSIVSIILSLFRKRDKSWARIGLAVIIIFVVLCVVSCIGFGDFFPAQFVAAMFGSGLLFFSMRSYWKGDTHGLYYGTIARSLAPIYACAILILALVVQPVLMTREAYWLKRDPILFGYITDRNNPTAGCTLIETRAAEQFMGKLRAALKEK